VIQISGNAAAEAQIAFELLDAQGRRVHASIPVTVTAGAWSLECAQPGVAPGVYALRVIENGVIVSTNQLIH